MATRRSRYRLLLDTVSIGRYASEDLVVDNHSVAIGRKAGNSGPIGEYAIAIGDQAGENNQSTYGIVIGAQAGQFTQGTRAIAIGSEAGKTSQGSKAIAIGDQAGKNNQPAYSIVISTSDTEIVAKKKGLFIDPIRKDDDRDAVPTTVKDGNTLIYNYSTKEVKNGFPRLPGYPNDSEVLLAFTQIKGEEGPALSSADNGTLYFDTTKKKVKVWVDNKWLILLDEVNYAKIKELLPALPAL